MRRDRLRSALGGPTFRQATSVALAADTVSIAIMEAIDNAFVLIVPGALEAGLGDAKFWWSIGLGFAIAFGPAFVGESLHDQTRSKARGRTDKPPRARR